MTESDANLAIKHFTLVGAELDVATVAVFISVDVVATTSLLI